MVSADSERGHAQDAPYDRVIRTASLSRVPAAWIAQSAPGARIVTPWKSTLQPAGLAVLPVGADRRDRALEDSNRRMPPARDAMDRIYAQPLGTPALARTAHVSEAHFTRTFRATFGEPPPGRFP